MAQIYLPAYVSGYEYQWGEDCTAVSEIHDVVHRRPTPTADSVDPVVVSLRVQADRLEACAVKHPPTASNDYKSMAASIRATLAITEVPPDEDDRATLNFLMESMNAVLAYC